MKTTKLIGATLSALIVAAALSACQGAQKPAASAGENAISAATIAKLHDFAAQEAPLWGDASPTKESAVLTTRTAALAALDAGTAEADAGSAYLVTLIGEFDGSGMEKLPAGATASTGTQLSFVLNANTFEVMDTSLSSTAPKPVKTSMVVDISK